MSNEAIDKNAPNYRSLASKAKGAGADCFVYSGITANNAVQLYKDFSAALPDAKLYGPDGVCESGFADPKEGGIPADVAAKFKCTVATLSPDEYPPEGQEFFTQFTEKYGEDNPDPYAIYGYEAMRARAGRDRALRHAAARRTSSQALFDTKDRESVLGTYSIDENGDTTLTDYGVYTIDGGELTFDQTIKAAGRLIWSLTDCAAGGWEEIPAPGGRLLEESHTTWKPQAFLRRVLPPRVRRCGTSSRSTG